MNMELSYLLQLFSYLVAALVCFYSVPWFYMNQLNYLTATMGTIHRLLTFPFLLYFVLFQDIYLLIAATVTHICAALLFKKIFSISPDLFASYINFGMLLACKVVFLQEDIILPCFTLISLLILAMLTTWILQALFLTYHNDQMVLIRQKLASADSGHMAAKFVSSGHVCEIFKDNEHCSRLRGDIAHHRRQGDLDDRHWIFNYWIPFTSYGVLGLTGYTFTELEQVFEEVKQEFGEDYSASNFSCQELALRVAKRATKKFMDLKFHTTNLKSLMLIVALYAVVFIYLIWRNVNITIGWNYNK